MNTLRVENSKNDKEFQDILKDILENETVKEMKRFKIHGNTTCFAHCYDVAYFSYLFCKKHNLDYKSMARAAMLHDLYLYDWHIKNTHKGLHGFVHPKIAYENASKIFKLNSKEKDIILTHMWPMTFTKLPMYKESFVLTIVDKQCAFAEFIRAKKYKYSKKKLSKLKTINKQETHDSL